MSFLQGLTGIPALAVSIISDNIAGFFGSSQQTKLFSEKEAELVSMTPPLMIFKYPSPNTTTPHSHSPTLVNRKIEIYQTSKGLVSLIKAPVGSEVKFRQLYSSFMFIKFPKSQVERFAASEEGSLKLDTFSFRNFLLKETVFLLEHVYGGGKIYAISRSNFCRLGNLKPETEDKNPKNTLRPTQGAGSQSLATSQKDILAIVFELSADTPEDVPPFLSDFGSSLVVGNWSSVEWEALLSFYSNPKALSQDSVDNGLRPNPTFVLRVRRLDSEDCGFKNIFEDALFLENSSSLKITPLSELDPYYVLDFFIPKIDPNNVELLFLSSNKDEWTKVDSVFGCVFGVS